VQRYHVFEEQRDSLIKWRKQATAEAYIESSPRESRDFPQKML
jgi:hypothetical protein